MDWRNWVSGGIGVPGASGEIGVTGRMEESGELRRSGGEVGELGKVGENWKKSGDSCDSHPKEAAQRKRCSDFLAGIRFGATRNRRKGSFAPSFSSLSNFTPFFLDFF